ncbi:MAG: PKD domain-containing protein [Thermoplasmatales archaeon]|nr:PKD domain-containing protein [Thermoplasmatales archaeon]
MKQKIKIIILIGCILTLVNMGIASIGIAEEPIPVELVYHADANGPYSGSVNVPVSFSGSGTYVSGSATYEWDFGDGSIGYGKYPTHSYSIPGEYIITLTVTDSTGDIYKDIAPVFINKPGGHLIPNGGCHYPADQYEEIEFDGTDSISTGADIVEYNWDFGDGTTGSGEIVTHSYDEERVYFVTLEVTDSNSVKRFDVLHADIGMSYSDDNDCYANLNVGGQLADFLEYLIDTFDFTTGFICSILDAKIYTNYNGEVKFTDLQGFRPLPVSIDVDNNGVNDIKVNQLKFFKTVKAPSLFDENSKVWYQFETTLSDVDTISGDITQNDDFTVALQLNFGIIASYLDLDDPIIRIGYHSASGETMPSSITVTHILRPYLLFRILGQDYWPEYGLKINQASGDEFSLFAMLLNSGGSSKTTLQLTFEDLGSLFMYKRTKTGGILNHDVILEIPGASNTLRFSAIREKSGVVTELSSGFYFTGSLTRGFGWSDQGVYIGILGETAVGLKDFYFNNPDVTITLGEISFSTSGSVNINFDKSGGRLSLDGVGTGFVLSDLFIQSSSFEGEIQGTLDLHLANSVFVALSPNELSIGFDGEIVLSSDCTFRINEDTVTVGGRFSIESDGDIAFSWGENELNLDLEAGLALAIQDFNFEVGNLIVNASLIEIETSGSFGILWDTENSLVTLSGGDGISSAVSDLEIIYDTENIDLYVSVYGRLEIQAGGWVRFGADTFEAGFEGILNLGTGGAYCEFDINGDNIKVGGMFEIEGNSGEISFSWADDEFTLGVSGGPTLSVEDLYFEIDIESGDTIKVEAENVEIGVSGEFSIAWDTINDEVTVNAGGDVSLLITNLEITYGTTLNIEIFGTLEIEGGGWLTFGENTFKAGFDVSLILIGEEDPYVIFEINGENIYVGGEFTFIGGSGEISFEWSNSDFSLSVSGSPELSVINFYFKATISNIVIEIEAVGIDVGANGDISVDWNAATEEMTITSDLGVLIGVENFDFDFDSGSLTVQIWGSLEIQADGYVNFAPGLFEAGFTGSLNLGGVGSLNFGDGPGFPSQGDESLLNGDVGSQNLGDGFCEFIINGESLYVGGLFSLDTGEYGEISFSWDGDDFSLYVSSDITLTVEELYFEAELQGANRQSEILKITIEYASIGADGDLSLDWDTVNNEITISSDFDVAISVTGFNFSYDDPTLVIIIDGTVDIQVNGYLTLGEGTFEAGFTGILDLGTNWNFCEFIVNTQSIKIGGIYYISTGDGAITFNWDENGFSLDYTGSATLSVDWMYFEAGDIKVTGVYIGLGADGDFSLDWDTVNNQITVQSDAGVSLSIENVNITYGTILDVKIIGSMVLQADGWLTFGDGVFEAGFSGTLDLGAGVEFEINYESIKVGGTFSLTVGDGEIDFTWADNQFSLSVSGGTSLQVNNLYFEAEISSETLTVEADEIFIGADGDLTIDWDINNEEITLGSVAGINFGFENIDVSYDTFDISIIGRLVVQGDGSISVEPGEFEASFSGSLTLSDGFGFEINSEVVKLEGRFNLQMGSGAITISWSEDELYCDLDGGMFLSIEDFYFEIEQLKIDAERAEIGFNGDLTITIDKSNKKFEIYSDLLFGFNNLIVNMNVDGNWHQICSVNNFAIGGGGYVLVDSNSEIVVDFNGQLTINNLQVTPPSNWNAGLYIGSASLSGNAYLQMEKDPLTGNGEFTLTTLSGDVTGTISQFNAYILIGSNDLDVSLWNFQIEGAFSIDLDNGDDEAILSASGLLSVTNLQVEYGDLSITTNIDIEGEGDFSGTYSDNNLDISIDAAFTWDIWLNSALIGEWEAEGNLDGNLDIEAVWSTGTGYVFVNIIEEGTFNLLDITHDDLNLNLVDILLPVGTVKFEWFRDSAQQEGYFLIDSELDGNPSANLATITWGTKSVSVGWPCIKPGDFKFEWDIPDRFLRFRNGIEDLAPTFTYKDTSTNFELFASSGSLPYNYSKAINFIWYEQNGQISGILIDTDGTYLAELIEIGFKKGSSGRKLAIYGLACDNFYIKKDSSGNLEWGGNIYLANHLIYSKLISDDWKDFDVEWNFQGQEKWIKFTKDPAFTFTLELLDVEIGGFEFTSTITIGNNQFFEVKWDIGVSGKISLDTNWEYFSTFDFEIWHPSTQDGVLIEIGGLRAQDWWVKWTAWPPAQWNLQTGGDLQIANIDIWVCDNGEWKQLPI